jgi:alpha-tubulin suppressor-like RCC1 family protein
VPSAVTGGIRFASLSAGGYHTCGVTSTGAVYCWGYGQFGQVGNGSTNAAYFPVLASSP